MTFMQLWNRLGKKRPTVNSSNKVQLSATVADLKKRCEGRADWETVLIPLSLKSGIRGIKGKDEAMWLIVNPKGDPKC